MRCQTPAEVEWTPDWHVGPTASGISNRETAPMMFRSGNSGPTGHSLAVDRKKTVTTHYELKVPKGRNQNRIESSRDDECERISVFWPGGRPETSYYPNR
jgi:hypothetical protein